MKTIIMRIIIPVIIAAAVIVSVPMIILMHETNERAKPYVKDYADSSYLKYEGYPNFYHYLFGEYAVCNEGDDSFSQNIAIRHSNGITYSKTPLTPQFCHISKYAFDPAGYIAYYNYVSERNESYTGEERKSVYIVSLGHKEYRVVDEYAGLYDTKSSKEIRFDTFDELLDYAEENSVNLGEFYYSKYYSAVNCRTAAAGSKDWSIVPSGDSGEILYKKHEIFTGNIKKYAVSGDNIFVELKISDDTEVLPGSNDPKNNKYINAKNAPDMLNSKGKVFIKINADSNDVKFFSSQKEMLSGYSDVKMTKADK